jgi:alpha-maltose-1-phosphate synthase
MKRKIAIVRGAFLNQYEMQVFEKMKNAYDLHAFSSLRPIHASFIFPTHHLLSPMDIPDIPYKMQIINRLFTDAHYLYNLEKKMSGFSLAHTAETYYHYTHQCLEAKKKGIIKKVVATVLENIPFNNEGIHGRKQFKKQARNELDHIIAITKNAKEGLILEGADEKKISVVGSAINTSYFKPRLKPKNKDPYKINLLYVGRLEVYKGIYELVYAVKKLVQDKELKKYTIQVTIIGEGSEKMRLREKENMLGISNLIKHKVVPYTQIATEYQNADIFIAPSKPTYTWQEQFGYMLLEAQAVGLPIVTTNTGAIPENVGNCASLVAAGDYVALADAIKRFMINPKMREIYGKNARERAISVHDTKIAAQKIMNIYEEVLNE